MVEPKNDFERGEWCKTVFATRAEAEAAVEKFEKARSIAT